jgi:hypothetical protein
MGFRKQRPGPNPGRSSTDGWPIGRDYVEDVRRHAERLGEAFKGETENHSRDTIARRRQEQIQRHMAQLRSEAVQARRLAEQIDNLSRERTMHERKTAMNNASLVGSESSRRASDKPRASGSQSNFNPLHPSMELPPEQLIRLLGLGGKKTRKQRKPPTVKPVPPQEQQNDANRAEEVAREASLADTWKLPDDMLPASRKSAAKPANNTGKTARSRTRRAYVDEAVFQRRHNALLVPAVAVGAFAGVIVSAYLFWWQPSSEQSAGAKPAGDAKPPIAATAAMPPKKTATNAEPSVNPVPSAPIERKQPSVINNEKWRAAVQAQEERLRAAAEERLRARAQATRTNAAETSGVVAPTIPQETVARLPDLPPQTANRSVEDENATLLTEDSPSAPAEQPDSATLDMSPVTPLAAPPLTDMPSPPQPASPATEDETTALQPSEGIDDTVGTAQGPSDDPPAENGSAQPEEIKQTPPSGFEASEQP